MNAVLEATQGDWIIRIGQQEFKAPDYRTLCQWYEEGRVPRNAYVYNPVLGGWKFASTAVHSSSKPSRTAIVWTTVSAIVVIGIIAWSGVYSFNHPDATNATTNGSGSGKLELGRTSRGPARAGVRDPKRARELFEEATKLSVQVYEGRRNSPIISESEFSARGGRNEFTPLEEKAKAKFVEAFDLAGGYNSDDYETLPTGVHQTFMEAVSEYQRRFGDHDLSTRQSADSNPLRQGYRAVDAAAIQEIERQTEVEDRTARMILGKRPSLAWMEREIVHYAKEQLGYSSRVAIRELEEPQILGNHWVTHAEIYSHNESNAFVGRFCRFEFESGELNWPSCTCTPEVIFPEGGHFLK